MSLGLKRSRSREKAARNMGKMNKDSWRWTIILGETEILDDDKPYTLIVGYVDKDLYDTLSGPYIRLWGPDDLFIGGTWACDVMKDLKEGYFRDVPLLVIQKCLDFAHRVEKLRAFA